MIVTPTEFDGLFVIEPTVHGDSRGYFMESYNRLQLSQAGIDITFVQDNQSKSSKGVLRGLHFQRMPYAQSKLVRVLSGRVLDVAFDLRRSKKTFGKAYVIELSSENKKQVFVPKGFAHGFVVLSDEAEFFYKCDEFYNPGAEAGIHYTAANIDWKFPKHELILSEKDRILPSIENAKLEF